MSYRKLVLGGLLALVSVATASPFARQLGPCDVQGPNCATCNATACCCEVPACLISLLGLQLLIPGNFLAVFYRREGIVMERETRGKQGDREKGR